MLDKCVFVFLLTDAHICSLIWASRCCLLIALGSGLGDLPGLWKYQRPQQAIRSLWLPPLLVSFQLVVLVYGQAPRAFQVSFPWKYNFPVQISWIPSQTVIDFLSKRRKNVLCLDFQNLISNFSQNDHFLKTAVCAVWLEFVAFFKISTLAFTWSH